MFVAAFDDRKKLPNYVYDFLCHTALYTPLAFLTPARKGWLNQVPQTCMFLQPQKLPRFLNIVDLFDEIFVNFSSNPYGFERACFLRWFALNAATTNLSDEDYVCLLDTDFILGVDPSALLDRIHEEANLASKSLDFVSQWNPDLDHVSPELTIFKKKVLFEFCLFLMTEFFDKSRLSSLVECYFGRIGKGTSGGVCDMTALASFLKEKKMAVFNLREESEEELKVISNFNSFSAEMASRASSWQLLWEGNSQILRFGSKTHALYGVHFQGSAKSRIKSFAAHRIAISSSDLY